jgi:macrolide-specific efflux system membrane fusion protein
VSTLTESGNVSAANQATVSSTATGVVTEVHVANGDQVTSGQALYKVEAVATEEEQSSAYSSYLGKVSSVASAQQNKQAVAAQVEQARASMLDAQAQVEGLDTQATPPTQTERDAAAANLNSARQNLSATQTKYNQTDGAISAAVADRQVAWLAYQATQSSTITAPISGTVANLTVAPGSSVSASGGSQSETEGTSAASSAGLVIGDFSQLYVAITANEVDLPRLKIGQVATVSFDAFADQTFAGSVAAIDAVGTNSSGVVTYGVRINLSTLPGGIATGMTAAAEIEIDRKDDVLTVPNRAITTTGSRSTVRVMQDSIVTTKTIEIGLSDGTNTEIISGLSEGETIITGTTSVATSGPSATTPILGGSESAKE